MLEEGSRTPALCSSMSWRAWIFPVDEHKLTSAGHVLALGWVDPKGCFLNLNVYTNPLGILLHAMSNSVGLGLGLRLHF